EKDYDKVENSKVIAPGLFKLNVSQCVSPISMSKSSCDSKNVEIKLKRKRRKRKSSKQNVKQVDNDVSRANNVFVHFLDLDTFSSVRRLKNIGVIWKKKRSSNTSNVGLSAVSVSNLNKNVKRYSRKDLLASNNSHLEETSSAYMCNDAMDVSCDSRMNDLVDDNNLFIFDDVIVRISLVSKMPFRKKPRDSMNLRSKGCSKHMTGNRALLTNFVETFLRTVHFGNNDFALIPGYGDVTAMECMSIQLLFARQVTLRDRLDQERINYPERVHVTTDYMVEGSDKGNWNKICYVSSAYKRHMSPMKHLFKRMIQRFRVEGTEEKEKKFIISYGVGEAFVETNEGRITISNVLFTPEVTLNILSIDQLEEQGYMVNYVNNRCRIKYMFDEMPEVIEQEATIEGEYEDNIFKSHNSFLDGYFRSLDSNEECSLVKGMEDMKMNKEDVHDYVDNEYLSLNGTLYAMKVNTFPRFISFLDLIKIDKLVYGNWEVLKGKFMEMLEWFYLGYLRQEVLRELPPVIGVIKIDLLGLYKFVDAMGGYMNVTFNNNWTEREDVNNGGNYEETNHGKETSTSSSDDFIIIT
nr:ARID DNA-binding domain-containing protein [Tanacetum cinerariifolium]